MQPAIKSGQFMIPQHKEGKAGHRHQDWQFFAQYLGVDGNGTEQGGQPEDQSDVGDIRAVGIAQSNAGIPLPGSQGRNDHLWCRGAETDNHHADQKRRHAKVTGGDGRPFDKTIGTPDQQRQAKDYGNNGKSHQGDLLSRIGSG